MKNRAFPLQSVAAVAFGVSIFLTMGAPALAEQSCRTLFQSERLKAATPEKARATEIRAQRARVEREKVSVDFMESAIRRSFLMTLAKLGGFQEHLDKFYEETISRGTPLTYGLSDGSRVTVSVEDSKIYHEKRPSVFIRHAGKTVVIQLESDSGSASRKYLVATYSGDYPDSVLPYSTVSSSELKDRRQQERLQMGQFISQMSPAQLAWLGRSLNGVPDSENPRPAVDPSISAPAAAEPAPLIPFKTFNDEAKSRVGWPSLNTGGSLHGYQLVARLLDLVFEKSRNAVKIEELPKRFEGVYDDFVQALVKKTNIIAKLQSMARNEDGKNGTINDIYSTKIVDQAQLGDRIAESARMEFWSRQKQAAFSQAPGGRYLTFDFNRYFYAVNLKALVRGELQVYVRHMENPDDKTYRFVFDSKGRPVQHLPEETNEAYHASQIFLEVFSDINTNRP